MHSVNVRQKFVCAKTFSGRGRMELNTGISVELAFTLTAVFPQPNEKECKLSIANKWDRKY